MAEQTPMPEPPDGSHVLIGAQPLQVLLIRDDESAAATTKVDPDLPEEFRWFLANDGDPLSWAPAVDETVNPLTLGLPPGLNRRVMCRLYTQEQLDQAVAEAKAEAGLSVVGVHIIEPGGYCRTCTSHHSTPEIARLEDRLAEEDRRGQ